MPVLLFLGFPVTDTAAKLAATKAVAADANATALEVLERLGDLNLRIHGLKRNYSELEDNVNAANQMIQDPEKNSKVLYFCKSSHKTRYEPPDKKVLERICSKYTFIAESTAF